MIQTIDSKHGKHIKLGNYQVFGYLKSSRISELLIAKKEQTREMAVIKRPLPAVCDDREIISIFKREAEILKNLCHDNICKFIEYFEIDKKPFIVMEYLHGKNLKEIIIALSNKNEFLASEIVAYISLYVCKGLSYAHNLKLLHRDISPANIIVTADGQVKILDFGIAIKKEMRVTDPSIIKGKIGYLSPEQIMGDSLDQRTDIFLLGICMYELATISQLFKGKNITEIANNILQAEVQSIRNINENIDPVLDQIILKALEKNVLIRHDTAWDMAEELNKYLNSKTNIDPVRIQNMMTELFPLLHTGKIEYKKFDGVYLSAEELGEETSDKLNAEEITLIK